MEDVVRRADDRAAKEGGVAVSNWEKVVRGLVMCSEETGEACVLCPYRTESCEQMPKDALELIRELLREREPKLLTLEEVVEWDGALLIESRVNGKLVWASWYSDHVRYGETLCRMLHIDGDVDDRERSTYGYLWRCWSARPTDEQREAVKWDD